MRRKKAFQKTIATLERGSQSERANIPADEQAAVASLFGDGNTPRVNQIVAGNCIDILNAGPEGWIDLVFADPPFNIGYLYHGYDDKLKAEDYLKFSRDWMAAVHRALKPTGSFYLAIGDDFAADLCVIARRELGFHMRNWIIWHYTFGQQTTLKFAKSHTHILYFTKEAMGPNKEMPFTFNADAVRVASARQTTYKDTRANPKGKLPDDTWYLRPAEAGKEYFAPDSDTWNVSRICGTFKEREGWHGCQMPIQVLNRIIVASSNPGDIVVDPFNGSGTTVVAAALLGRRYVGIDKSPEYVAYAKKRLDHTLQATHDATETDGNGKPDAILEAATDPSRASRIVTPTDAFGRERVKRGRRAVRRTANA